MVKIIISNWVRSSQSDTFLLHYSNWEMETAASPFVHQLLACWKSHQLFACWIVGNVPSSLWKQNFASSFSLISL